MIVGICILLAATTWLVFGQTLRHEFINYDDPDYVTENTEVATGITLHGIAWAFTHRHSDNWHPLTTLSHMFDCQVYGLKPGAHHLTNVVLHIFAVVLLFLVLREMTGNASGTGDVWRSAFVAAVFAIHPLHVESVAWIAERKDVLSGVFFMLTLAAYVRYTRRPSIASYLLVALVYALGLMSKPMLVTLPLVLLLLDYWPLGRVQNAEDSLPRRSLARRREDRLERSEANVQPAFALDGLRRGERSTSNIQLPTANRGQTSEVRRLETQNVSNLILEKLPLLLFSVASCVVTLVVQKRTISSIEALPLWVRVYEGFVSCATYVHQMFWPSRLALFYPYPTGRLSIWPFALAMVLLIVITAATLRLRKRYPYLITGWLWYLVMLVPVIGIIQVGTQARADRYTYLPQIGLYLLIAWGVSDLSASWPYRRSILRVLAIIAVVVLSWRAWIQTSYWKNSESIWTRTLGVTASNALAHGNLGLALLNRGQLDDGISHVQEALKMHVDSGDNPTDEGTARLHYNLGNAFSIKAWWDKAIFHYTKVLRWNHDYQHTELNLGTALFRAGRIDEAMVCWQRAVASHRDEAEAHANLGDALLKKELAGDALAHYEKSLAVNPRSPEALNKFAWALSTYQDAKLRNGSRAIQLARQADELAGGKNPIFIRTLAAAYAEGGRFNDAIDAAQRGLQLAAAQGDPALVGQLRKDIDLYRIDLPLR